MRMPIDMEHAQQQYFDWLFDACCSANDGFHKELEELVDEVNAAETPADLGLDLPAFSVTRRRVEGFTFENIGLKPGPLKARDWIGTVPFPCGLLSHHPKTRRWACR